MTTMANTNSDEEIIPIDLNDTKQATNTELKARSTRETSMLRKVMLPNEHGGWGLTAEPALLGIIMAPGVASVCIAFATVIGFLARTPLRIILVDNYRERDLERTALARKVFAVEAFIIAILGMAALWNAGTHILWPLIVIIPIVAFQFWYDSRSKSRHFLPELAGSVGVCGVASMSVLAGGKSVAIALAVWTVLGARAISAITRVRFLVKRLHEKNPDLSHLIYGDIATLAVGLCAIAIHRGAFLGVVGIVAGMIIQSIFLFKPKSAQFVGVTEIFLGLFVVICTSVGFSLVL